MKAFILTFLCLAVTAQGLHLHKHIDDPLRGNWECLKKYLVELDEINQVLAADLKECALNPSTQAVCTQNAVQKAILATNEITAKCSDDSSNHETLIGSDNSYQECTNKYYADLKIAQSELLADFQGCSDSEDVPNCIQTALQTFKNTKMELGKNLIECIKGESNVPAIETSHHRSSPDSIHTECLEKYAGEYAEVKDNLVADIKICENEANPKVCMTEAIEKAKIATAEITKKVYQCIKDGSFKRRPHMYYGLELGSIPNYKKCFEKYAPEFTAVRENLKTDLENCKTSENVKDCVMDALQKSKTALLEISAKIRDCLQEGDQKAPIAQNFGLIEMSKSECRKQLASELVEHYQVLMSDIKDCVSAENKIECTKAAVVKSKNASTHSMEKFKECMKNDE